MKILSSEKIWQLVSLILFFSVEPIHAQNSNPNIIIILADDLGYGDLGCYGSTMIKTPVLDKLATQGVRLTDFYSNGPECTPTRAALLTGRYQQRVGGLECAIGLGNIGRYDEAKMLSDKGELGLPQDFNALPNILAKQGYKTALIGKWHLGNGETYTPRAHGFDYSIGPLGGAVDYYHHTEPVGMFIGKYMEGDHDFYRNSIPHIRTGYYMTHLLTDEAVEWIDHQEATQPFFLYVPYTTPHRPHQAPGDFNEAPLTMDHWNDLVKDKYVNMVEDMDNGIGKILKKLKEKGLEDNTIVIFFSDNGPTPAGSTGPFSGNKGHVYEGGIRVPCIIRWPGNINEGMIVRQPFISMDITASIAAIIGEYPEKGLDGIDLIEQIMSGKPEIERQLFWRKKRGSQVRSAVRSGDTKYIKTFEAGVFEEHIYNLTEDPAESRDLKEALPEALEKMRTLLSEWEDDVQPERYE